MYEINTLLLLPLKIYLIVLKHIKSLILLKKLVFISNFRTKCFHINVFICFYSTLIALILHSYVLPSYELFSYTIHHK